MPTYKVIKPGFHGGYSYDPEGKRKTLTVDAPFKKCPSWLQPIKEVSPTKTEDLKTGEIKKRLEELGVEFKGNAKKEDLQALLDEAEAVEQDAQNKRDIDAAVSFQEAPSLSGPVQTI